MTLALRQRPLARVVMGIVKSANGAWFDPSDMSTLYQDAAGTIPVTAVEQPVGKMLDKSGNNWHATQNITASRPTLSARYNMLTKTEDFSDAVWSVYAQGTGSVPIKTNNYGIAPDGSQTAGRIQLSLNGGNTNSDRSDIYTGVSTVAGMAYSIDVWFKTADNTTKTIALNFNFFGGENVIITGVWQKFTVSLSSAIDTYRFMRFGLRGGSNTSDSADILIWHPQQVVGLSAGPYQRVNTATDYDTDPRYFPKYLRFDGVDDYLNLPYMGLYVAGSASVVTTMSSLGYGGTADVVAERSTSLVLPVYTLLAIPSASINSGGYIRNDSGSVLINSIASSGEIISPLVIKTIIDSGSSIKKYINSNNADTDNYVRTGTLSLTTTTIGASNLTSAANFLTGKLYSLIITKSALTDYQRVACERYLGRKSGVQL